MDSIRVAVRIRPDEVSFGDSCLQIDESSKALKITKKLDDSDRTEAFDYAFDNVFGPETSQEQIFSDVRELIDESLNGFNVTVFAFGMTGSGKTFTIAGTLQQPGIVPRTVNHIFTDLQQKSNKSKDTVAMVFLTYVELYNNSLYDLLASELPDGEENAVGLKLHEYPKKGMQISGSPTLRAPVTSAEQALKLISQGNKLRATSSTNLNKRSSRSHTVISFEIVSQDISAGAARVGKINLVDLAGSERVKESGAEGQAMEEAKQINKALSVLGDVLNSLSKYHQGQSLKSPTLQGIKSPSGSSSKSLSPVPHIPFRNSKLTMLLKDSLGGNAKTMMIATIRTSAAFYQQSLVSLRYAARARHIKCNPIQNVADTVGEGVGNIMQQTLLEVNRLKAELEHRNEESNALKARLNELQKSKKQSEAKGNAFAEKTKKKLLEQIDDLQVRSGKERQELTERLRSVIHNHEGTLAAKQKVHVHLQDQLALKSSHIEALSYEHKEVLVSKEKAEIIMNDVTLRLRDRDALILKLKDENSLLSSALIAEKNKTEKITVAAVREKEQLVDALQKLTSSRNKHKKRSEEHSASLAKLSTELIKNNLSRDDHIVPPSGESEGSDVIVLQLEELLKENAKKYMEERMEDERKMKEIGNEKNKAVSDMERFRSENVLLMENVLQLDSEWKKGTAEASKSQNILEETISELKNALRKEEISRNILKDKTKELSIELKDSLLREAETVENESKIIEKYKQLQSENFRLQNVSVLDTEKERTHAEDISVLTQKIIENDEKYQLFQINSEKYRQNSEAILENLKKEISEITGNATEQDEKILKLGCEISCLQLRNEELGCDLKAKNGNHKEEIISLLAAAENMRNEMTDAGDYFLSEKQEIQRISKESEKKLETEIKKQNELFVNLRLESTLEGGVFEGVIASLRDELQVSRTAMGILEATISENEDIKTDYSTIKALHENVKLENERIEAENKRMKSEFEGTTKSLSDDLTNSNEKLSHSIDKSESDEREKIIKHEYGKKIMVLTEQLMKLRSEYSMQSESYCTYKIAVEEKVKEVKEKSQVELKSIEEQANVEGARESDVLNNRIAMMVSQEEDMFSFLKGRLIDLDDARSKLIKLQQSAMNGDKSDLQLYLLAEQQEAQLALEDKLATVQVKVISFEAELKRSRDANKDLLLELEKKSKQLALEQQKSRTYLSDRDRIRKITAEELKNTVSLVRKRVEIGQTRRHSEFISARDNMMDNLSSTGRMYQNKSSSRSTSVISDESIDTNIGNMSFEDAVWT